MEVWDGLEPEESKKKRYVGRYGGWRSLWRRQRLRQVGSCSHNINTRDNTDANVGRTRAHESDECHGIDTT